MFFEEIKLEEHFGFYMFPKPMGPFPPDYDGGRFAPLLGYSVAETDLAATKKSKNSLHHEKCDQYMQMFLWLVLKVAPPQSLLEVTRETKRSRRPLLTPNGLIVL
jgi:hypothetical protein